MGRPLTRRGAGRSALGSVTTALMVLTVLAAVVVAGGRVLGVRTLVEKSDSMYPAIATGDLVVSRDIPASAAAAGEVITFPDVTRPGTTLTHRVVSVRRAGDILVFDTRGDANTGHEFWTAAPAATIGRTETVIPRAGLVVAWLGRPVVAATMTGLLVAAIVLLLAGALGRRAGGVSRDAGRVGREGHNERDAGGIGRDGRDAGGAGCGPGCG
ncbi:signal peptidase I, partial [Actinoplanes sp. RD1]|uniref:signal peptidase I n=1 Tax=Actinoplanes sp. RD1 TaxID=3064538 RepID=UPI0027405045